MLRYLSRYRRQSLDPKSTMDTYIEAYKLTHETYQNQQEADTTKITEENAKVLKRTKRSAAADPPDEKDFIKFELTDAIQPDADTLKHRVINKGKNFRMPFEISDTLVVFGNKTDGVDIEKPTEAVKGVEKDDDSQTKQVRRRRRKSKKENSKPKREIFDDDSQEDVSEDEDDGDMSIGESRKIKIIAPAGKTRNGEIPIGVQKIIEMVLQDRARAAKARSSKGQKPYGEKVNFPVKDTQQRQKNVVRDTHLNGNNEWRPVPQVSLGRYPVIHNQMENAPDYLTFVPVKSYKTVSYGKPVSEIKQQPTPTILPVTSIVPVPQIQYIIKEVPVPVTSSLEASKLKPSFKITYDTSLLDSKLKDSSIDLPTKAPSPDTSESYVKIITPTTATKTVIDHKKKPEYKSPTAAPTYEKLTSNDNSFFKGPSPTLEPSYDKLSSFGNTPFKPSRPAYVAPTVASAFDSHFESQKLDALTSLLNKDPAEQLKGFHELLQEEKNKGDPTPILFHPNGIIPPKPKIKLNIKVLDDVKPQKQEPITIEEFNRLYGHEKELDLPGYSPPKEFTPIKEEPPADFDGYKTSFKSITEPSKSNFEISKVQYKPIVTSAISEIKGPVIQHHDHSASRGVSKGYASDSDVSKILLFSTHKRTPFDILQLRKHFTVQTMYNTVNDE